LRDTDHNTNCNRALADRLLISCPHCDLLQRIPEVEPGASVRCPRCNKELWRHRVDSINRTLALTFAALILFIIANTVPMLGLTVVGRRAFTTVAGGAFKLWENGQHIVAVLVMFVAVVAPALEILIQLFIGLGCLRKHPPAWIGFLLRHLGLIRTWSMIEVMLLGVLVALTKIGDYATVIPGIALFSLFALVVLLAALQSCFDPRAAWEKITWAEPESNLSDDDALVHMEKAGNYTAPTALGAGLQSCLDCGLLSKPPEDVEEGRCPRCDEELVFRKHDSLNRTIAYLIAASICYIPANFLPVMTTITSAGKESDTIMQGVVLLWSPTGWPLSLIVLFASIMIPSAKILGLFYLVISVKRGSIKNSAQRNRLYRVIDIIGRWSMVDVFVDTFTVALIQLQPLMAVEPGPGLLFFAAVVVFTMMAVESFDPRLIWDSESLQETETEVKYV